jgi:hypothetical protein
MEVFWGGHSVSRVGSLLLISTNPGGALPVWLNKKLNRKDLQELSIHRFFFEVLEAFVAPFSSWSKSPT